MRNELNRSTRRVWEGLFQFVLLSVVFIFYSVSRRHPEIEFYEMVFFLNYAIASYIIMYGLLPTFLYKKRYIRFILASLLLIASVIIIEEAVLEQIFFPDTRGKGFPGVFDNLASCMPTITILTGFKFAWDALLKQSQVDQLRDAVIESELQFLKTQINPHFLFNNLNNLYSYSLENSPKTPQIILELSSFMRYMLYECQAEYVDLEKEIEQLKNYINLSRLQCEEQARITFKSKINGNYQIAPLILHVFIENAFKHSLSSQSQGISITINLFVGEDGVLRFECQNTFAKESNTQNLSRGIGLENVRKRLQLLYPSTHNLDVSKAGNIFNVHLWMDLTQTRKL